MWASRVSPSAKPLVASPQPDTALRCAPLLESLSPDQRKAVTATGHVLVVACPGAGKTRVLQTRATYLLEREARARACAVTFTKDAAQELKGRIAQTLPARDLERIVAGTFHSLALAQIRQAGLALPLVNGIQHSQLVRRAAFHHREDLRYTDAIESIEHMKTSLRPQPREGFEKQDTEVFNHYQSMLDRHGLMDFSDILIRAARGLINGKVKPLAVDYLLVDEFQDADEVQHIWIDAQAALPWSVMMTNRSTDFGMQPAIAACAASRRSIPRPASRWPPITDATLRYLAMPAN